MSTTNKGDMTTNSGEPFFKNPDDVSLVYNQYVSPLMGRAVPMISLDEANAKVAPLVEERDRWLWEYQNLCKFANDYEVRIAELEAALRGLTDKLERISNSQEFNFMFSLAFVHGHAYKGESWELELQNAREVLEK